MSEYWIVDGYNLLHEFQGRSGKRSDFTREALFTLLANFASLDTRHVSVILDGVGNEEEFKAYVTPVFTIQYSQKVSADAFIERFVYDHKDRYSLIVVTNDTAIINIARGVGARTMRGNELKAVLAETKRTSEDILFDKKVRGHGFNRPFDSKLKDLGKNENR